MSAEGTVEALQRAALEVFASRGLDATVRQVSAHAGVSHGLVRHHFGSRDGLRKAVDDYVVARVISVFALSEDAFDEPASLARRERVARFSSDEPEIAAYMGRLMAADPEVGQPLFDALVHGVREELERLQAIGQAKAHADLAVVAVQIVLLELGALALRPLVERHLGLSLTSPDGARRWSESALDLLTNGIYGPPES
jgi:AcrR family transcriptional regulator